MAVEAPETKDREKVLDGYRRLIPNTVKSQAADRMVD